MELEGGLEAEIRARKISGIRSKITDFKKIGNIVKPTCNSQGETQFAKKKRFLFDSLLAPKPTFKAFEIRLHLPHCFSKLYDSTRCHAVCS